MNKIVVFTDGLSDVEWVSIEDDNGVVTCMSKATYDVQQANQTLPSNSSTPQAGA
jgi:hypothetical protein